MAEMMRVPQASIALGTDGCSLPTFGAPLAAFARSWATLADPDNAPAGQGREHGPALKRLRAAMMEAPENVAGDGEYVTDLIDGASGSICAKSGAEGLICLALPEAGLGIAIRVLDGSYRAHPALVAETLRQLGLADETMLAELDRRHPGQLRNHNGRLVGDIRAVFRLEGPAVA